PIRPFSNSLIATSENRSSLPFYSSLNHSMILLIGISMIPQLHAAGARGIIEMPINKIIE
ncbi:MAG: hypothetical protein QNJ78_14285, partial [Gammaproteobacteria bacterium]|nr:hypothetical protein [Gammaproteobacteria bacterium]